jgi:L-ribulokinase
MDNMPPRYVLGVDFGSDSVRSLVMNAEDGEPLGSAVVFYRRWTDGRYSKPEWGQFRQHPLDHLEGLQRAVRRALEAASQRTRDRRLDEKVVGLGVDTTGSTVAPVDTEGNPLALRREWRHNPNAMFLLWKDHTAAEEAERINKVAKSFSVDYTKYSGSVYSAEWFFAKILHVLRHDRRIRREAASWVEHCDWMVGLLVGNTRPSSIWRSRCAAGHKAMWHESWAGLPDQRFLSRVDPLLNGLRARLYRSTATSDQCAGTLSPEWAGRLGLPPTVRIAAGALDAHFGAVGAKIRPRVLSKVIGTSTCDMLVVRPKDLGSKVVSGLCGQVDGSILPGYLGLEAGQSSCGDIFAWLRDLIDGGVTRVMGPRIGSVEERRRRIYRVLNHEATRLRPGETGLIGLDWFNGRRTPWADPALRGALVGLNLGTSLAGIYRALIEAVAFGSRKIMDRIEEEGLAVDSIIACGGLSKVELVMQIHADVLGKPIYVSASDETCALGAAIFGAVASGVWKNAEQGQEKMCAGFRRTYRPDPRRHRAYERLYDIYGKAGSRLEPVLREISHAS